MYHNATSTAPVGHHDNQVCIDCHPHRKGFPSFTTVFNPVKRWFSGLLGTGSAYAKPPAWVTDGALPPGLQNHSLPPQAWANGLKRFRAGYEIVRRSSAQQSSQSAIKDDIILYYHNDHLGTPCFLTGEQGAIVWRREQTPFGVTSFERGTTTENIRFPGQYWDDEKQSSYNGFRDSYTPGLGRYTQADPIGQASGGNLFSYSYVNPANNIDPVGLDPGDFFETELEAAIDAIQYAYYISKEVNIEITGWIYYVECKGFTYDEPEPGIPGDEHVSHSGDWPPRLSADYHTHGTDDPNSDRKEKVSVPDILHNQSMAGLAGYLGTPRGQVIYYKPPNIEPRNVGTWK